MILAALVELAKAEGLMQDPDYEQKEVTRIIELDKNGKLLGITDVREPDKKGKLRAKRFSVPKAPGRTSGIAAQFLYDKSDYFLGIEIDKKGNAASRTNGRLDQSLDKAIELHQTAFSDTKDEGLGAVISFLNSQRNNNSRDFVLREHLKEPGTNEWFVFRLSGDQSLVSDRPAVREWWKRRRIEAAVAGATCLVTGESCVPVSKHDAIKKVPGGSTSGVSLVSFNDAAFESYGLKRNDNAPVSRGAAEAYARALNRLLDPAYPDPHDQSKTLPRRNIRLNENTAVVFWTADAKGDFADLFESLMYNADAAAVGRLLEAPKTGKLPRLQDSTPFYALTISGGQGRAVIRDWFATSVAEMANRLKNYFEDLDLAFPFESPPRPSLVSLLRSVVLGGEDKNIPPNLAADFLQAILRGQPLPQTLLHAAIRRCKAEGPVSVSRQTGKPDWNRSHLRIQIIKAVLRRFKGRPELSEVKSMLDEANTQPSYLLGRLFAVLEGLQGAAQGQTNATIGDRFYGAASSAPVTVFARLLALSKHHLAKLRGERPGQAINLDKTISAVIGLLPAEKFPPVLPMEEQGLFAVGYYHQRQALFSKKDKEVVQINK